MGTLTECERYCKKKHTFTSHSILIFVASHPPPKSQRKRDRKNILKIKYRQTLQPPK